MILFKARGRPGQAGPEKAKRWIQVTHKLDVASSRHAFGPTAPAVTTTACRGLGWGLGKGRDQDETRCPASGKGTSVTVAEHPGGAGLCGKRVTPVPSLVRKRGCPQLGQGRGGLNGGESMSLLHSTSVEGKGSACWCGRHPH